MSKNDILSFRLTQIESDPKNPQAESTPERFIDYRFEDPLIRIENNRFKTLAHLKENDCWDTQDLLEENQDTHTIFMICRTFADALKTRVAGYTLAKVQKTKTDSDYLLKSQTPIQADVAIYQDFQCLTILLVKPILHTKLRQEDQRFSEIRNHQFTTGPQIHLLCRVSTPTKISMYTITTIQVSADLSKPIKLEDQLSSFSFLVNPSFPLEPNPKLAEFSLQNTLMIFREPTFDQLKKKDPFANSYIKLVFLDTKETKYLDFSQQQIVGKIRAVHSVSKEQKGVTLQSLTTPIPESESNSGVFYFSGYSTDSPTNDIVIWKCLLFDDGLDDVNRRAQLVGIKTNSEYR